MVQLNVFSHFNKNRRVKQGSGDVSEAHCNDVVSSETTILREKLHRLEQQNDVLVAELKENNSVLDHYRQAVDNSPNAIFSINCQGSITTWNPACSLTFQYDSSILGEDFRSLFYHPDEIDFLERSILNSTEIKVLSNIDLSYRCRNGDIREMVSRIYPVKSSDGIVHGFVFANTDVTERNKSHRELDTYRYRLEEIVDERTAKLKEEIQQRKTAQKGLQASYDSVVTILDSMDLAIQVTSLSQSNIIFMNNRLKTLISEGGIAENRAGLFDAHVPSETESSEHIKTSTVFEKHSGCWYLLQERIIPWLDDRLVRLQVATDITERKNVDEELKRVEKLDSLGVLAGGIAHDFNNLLTGIMGNLSILKSEVGTNNLNSALVDSAVQATARATSLTQQLLTFSKGGDPVCSVINVDEILGEAVKFSLRGSAVRAHMHLDSELLPVEADPGQLSQVFHNLVINAKQVMPEGGELSVLAKNHTIGSRLDNTDLQPGEYIKINFIDNGPGIKQDIKDKIFDPYFTTKEMGEGIGLATVHKIIENHKGQISVGNHSEGGANFQIMLPCTKKSFSPLIKQQPLNMEFNGRILLMDDEKIIRDVATAMLTHLGFNVDVTADGEAALVQYKEAFNNGDVYDAVILDLTIPGGMGGKKTALNLVQINPDVKIIASSGYSNDRVLAESSQNGFAAILKKPYKLENMVDVLRSLQLVKAER